MDFYEILGFSLSDEEKEECKRKGIPSYYWYYLKLKEKGWSIQELRVFIANRLKRSLLSADELRTITRELIKIIRVWVEKYQQIEKINIQEMDSLFREEVFNLFQNILAKREKSFQVKRIKTHNIKSKVDQEILRPSVIVPSGGKTDEDCLYFEECENFAHKNGGQLDCQRCPNYNRE